MILSNLVPGSVSALQGKKILLVEDDLLCAEMFRVFLEGEGAEIKTSARTFEALDVLREWMPDLIISDLGLPDEDGISLIKKIRSNSHHVNVPAIALTGYGKDEGARAMAAGFQLYISKPVEPDQLLNVVNKLLQCTDGIDRVSKSSYGP
jgi:CheY-like chemotaxis protein